MIAPRRPSFLRPDAARLAATVSSALAILAAMAAPANAQGSYVNFESPQVRPIAVSPDGTRLFAANTADGRLSVFDLVEPSSPKLLLEIPVGIEPVTVRPRTNDEVWVVNHTSDTVSVVSISVGRVVDTIPAGDEPGDVVFAGATPRAFVSASRANEIRVFDLSTHALVSTIPVFGEHPRALATSPDGSRVYAAFALAGNRTTVVPANLAPPPPPPTNGTLPQAPQVGLVVDAADPAWSGVLAYTMPDHDVVEIDANSLSVVRTFSGVGTSNLGLAVRPTNGDLFVANTEARNLVRFEPNLKGHLVDNRVTRITAAGGVTAFDLNPGIDYQLFPNLAALATSLAQPTDVVFDPSGAFLYVAAFGTDRVGKVDASGAVVARIEVGPVKGTTANSDRMRGPRGLALHAAVNRLYVQNRVSNTISVVSTSTLQQVNEIPVGGHEPTPSVIRNGRGFLYDAKLSGNGTAACSACHVDADKDLLAWDLGDPGGSMSTVPNGPFLTETFHPMKGPMTTQSLKGLAGVEPLHWRGDRVDFLAFNPAFGSLLGGTPLSGGDMAAYRNFIETIVYEPNPNQNLDRTLPASFLNGNPQTGQTTFVTNQYQPLLTCATCHVLPAGTTGPNGNGILVPPIIPGVLLQESQSFNIPQLRDMYQKSRFSKLPGDTIGGIGFLHDGSSDTIFNFLTNPVFGNVTNDATKKNDLEAFLMCFDTGTAPAAGYARTVNASNAGQAPVAADVALLQGQASLGNVDLVGKGLVDGRILGLLYVPALGHYASDSSGFGPYTWSQLQAKALANTAEFTLMGVPFGSGTRIGVDRDLDGTLDGDEPANGSLSNYGAATGGCSGALGMGGNSFPYVGNDVYAFTTTNAPPNSVGLLLLGDAQDLAGTTILGVKVHVSLFASTFLLALPIASEDTGLGIAPLPLPANPLLAGFVFYAQTLWVDGCGPMGISASDAIRMAIYDD